MSVVVTIKEPAKCHCDEPATRKCVNCKRSICDDNNCGTDTVDGYLCGTYTQWGCAKKYTNCDECENDVAIHEADFNVCDECSVSQCDACAKKNFVECEGCGINRCKECAEEHKCGE